ncbi:hypothetical protein [Bacillus sp. 7884-1]|uniref:hypothetical protein n=1 Tax=Bacillus sp. 7884-1 TaxID=2021693 RepID=UPI000BA7BBFA|nr:hypothetical protein [Bacillus sp. 7884-1]PAE31293.1 hypothetical protein CHI06_28690 [Bacillus sp. 7884-1]
MRLQILKGTIGGIIGAVAGFIFGLYIGMNFYSEDFVFNGLRGYEAASQIGAFIGGLLGAVSGFLLALIMAGLKGNQKSK